MSLLLLIIALAGLAFVRPTMADGPDKVSLGIAPLDYKGQYFDLTMSPGESRTLKVEVANHGTKEIAARTYAADAYTIINGGFGARLDGEPVSGTSNWLVYPAQTIDLPPGKGLTRSFTVTVPTDAGPGEYITSLVVQNAEPTAAGSGGVAIKQVQRQVIAVVVTVPGPRKPALAIGSVEHKYLSATSIVSATITNTGNVRLKPSGELVVSDMDGREISRFPLTMDSVYAGDTASVEAPFNKALLPGGYRVTLTLDHEGGTAMVAGVQLTVPKPTQAEASGAPSAAGGTATVNQQQPATPSPLAPLFAVAAAGAALALLGALIVVRLRRRRSPSPGPPEQSREPRDGPLNATPATRSRSGATRSASAPHPTAPRHPLAGAAYDRQDGRPLDRSWFEPPQGAAPNLAAIVPAPGPRPTPTATATPAQPHERPPETPVIQATATPAPIKAVAGERTPAPSTADCGTATGPRRRAARPGAASARPWLLALAAAVGGLAFYMHGLHARHNVRDGKA